MEEIFELISAKPVYTAWAFGIVNAFWLAFVYFNAKRHEKELIKVRQTFDLDLERRKKVFEMKATQYESYFKHIDAVHRKHQTDYQDVLTPIMSEFMSSYLTARDEGDEKRATQATVSFSEKISRITRDGFQELGLIESETNSLRLTASDEVAKLLDEIADLYNQMFSVSGKMMSDLVEITIHNNQQLAAQNQSQLMEIGAKAKRKAAEVREAMRNDLKKI